MKLDELRAAIEAHFWVHPEVGDHSLCATGEPYEIYSISVTQPHTKFVEEFLVGAMLCTFLCLRYGTAPSQPPGAPAMVTDIPPSAHYGDMRGPFLYWRFLPSIESHAPGVTGIYCRARVSKTRASLGQIKGGDPSSMSRAEFVARL